MSKIFSKAGQIIRLAADQDLFGSRAALSSKPDVVQKVTDGKTLVEFLDDGGARFEKPAVKQAFTAAGLGAAYEASSPISTRSWRQSMRSRTSATLSCSIASIPMPIPTAPLTPARSFGRFSTRRHPSLRAIRSSPLGWRLQRRSTWRPASAGLPGALGIPGHLPTHFKQLYEYLGIDLGPHIENAFHAIALDEHRSDFAPTLWTQPETQAGTEILEQTWFSGAHLSVGGGYDEHGLSDVTLAGMAATAAPLLALDIEKLDAKQDRTFAWGLGGVVDSFHGFWSLLGKISRQPGRHEQAGATNESLHASVAERLAKLVGGYKCPALEHMVGGPLPTSPLPSVELQLRWSGTSPKAPPPAVQSVDLAMRQ